MAFGVNQKQDFGQTISTVADAQRNTQFQTALQERFDVNSAKIEEAIQRVSAIPLLRDKDKEYLQKNMSNILNNVNANIKASGGRSLLNNNMSGQLTKLVGSSIDDYLVEQMSISAQKQQFDTQVAEERKKDANTFNAGNYQYSLDKAGWNEYMEGKEDSLKGGLQYIPYSDWSANATKKATELAKLKGKRTIEIVDETTGRKTIKSIEGLRPDEVAEYLPNLLSSQDLQQMRIDGYIKGKTDPQGTKMEYDLLLDSQITKATAYKKAAEATYNSATDATIKANAKRQMDNYDAVIKQSEEKKSNNDFESMGYDLVYSKGRNILVDQLSTEESISYEMDDVFKFNAEMAMKKAELELDAEANALKKEENAIASGTSLAGMDVTPISQDKENMKVEDRYSAVKNEHDQAYNRIVGMGLGVLESDTVDQGTKEIFTASLLEQGFKVIEQGDGRYSIEKDANSKINQSKSNAIHKAISDSKALPKSGMIELNTLVEDKNYIAKALIKANQEFGKDVDTDSLVNALSGAEQILSGKGTRGVISDVAQRFDVMEWGENIWQNISPLVNEDTESSKARMQKHTEISNFIKNNGGIEKIRQQAKSNPALAQQMVKLLDEASSLSNSINKIAYDGGNLTRDLAKAGEVLEKEGWSSFFKDKSAIQITSEKAKENIVNSIDQSLIQGGKGFDTKKGGITATPYYNTRGQIEGFDIVQYNTENKDGQVFTKARVDVSTLAGQKLMSKLAKGDEKDAMKVPNNTTVSPMYRKIENPFPTDVASTDRELDDFTELGLTNDPNFKTISAFLNSGTGTVKQNVLTYAKSQLYGKYSEQEIEETINKVDEGFRTGEYTVNLKTNKLPSQGTAKWVATFEKDGKQLVPSYNFVNTPTLPKNAENYFRAYPQYVALNQIVEALKKGTITPSDL
jgi:hypothetical protein